MYSNRGSWDSDTNIDIDNRRWWSRWREYRLMHMLTWLVEYWEGRGSARRRADLMSGSDLHIRYRSTYLSYLNIGYLALHLCEWLECWIQYIPEWLKCWAGRGSVLGAGRPCWQSWTHYWTGYMPDCCSTGHVTHPDFGHPQHWKPAYVCLYLLSIQLQCCYQPFTISNTSEPSIMDAWQLELTADEKI